MTNAAEWIFNEFDEDLAVDIAREINVPVSIGGLLVQRGYTDPESAEMFLRPRLSNMGDPFDLPDMPLAAERIWRAVKTGEKITVHGDYDADGITSTALLVKVLSMLGAKVSAFIPHRIEDGYGLTAENVLQCVEDFGTKLMITVDCGTGSTDAADRARELGVDLVVTDHHESSGDIAQALALVNPKLGEATDARNLAGVGVAFKLCHALLIYGRDKGYEEAGMDLRPFLDLVALGTVADIVPLLGENRALTRYGLQMADKTENIGLRALLQCAGAASPLRAYNLAFQIAPRINAAGRVGSARRALDLLLTEDPDEAQEIAEELDQENRERQKIEAEVVTECERQLRDTFDPQHDYAIVAAGAGWHRGVVGIAASRIMREHYRPTFIIALDEDGAGHGSGRSIEGFSLVQALADCSDLLDKFGGHDMAAGLSITRDKVKAFRKRLNEVARKKLAADDLVPKQRVDAWIDLDDVGEELYEAQCLLAPFGEANRNPIWAVSGLRFMSEPREVGKGHLKARVGAGNTERDAIGFNLWGRVLPEGPMDIAFKLERNEYRGRVSYQLNICDIRPATGFLPRKNPEARLV